MRLPAVLLLSVLILPAAAVVSDAARPAKHYVVQLDALNGSGVSGEAHLVLDGGELTVTLSATGLEPGELHPQHIHGFMDNQARSTCPPPVADDDDGLVDLLEGLPSYGPVLLPLLPFRTAPTGEIDDQQTFTVDVGALGPLQNRAIVLHGLTVRGQYVPTLPVACGTLEPAQGRSAGKGPGH